MKRHFVLKGIIPLVLCSLAIGQTTLTTLTIKNLGSSALSNYPVTVSQVFTRGDVPNGIAVVSNATPYPTQMDVKTRHSDGSVSHAILSFILPALAGNGSSKLSIATGQANATLPAITKAQILASDFDAVVSFAIGSETYMVSARDLLNSQTTPEMWLDGPIVREFLLAGVSKTPGNSSNAAIRVQFQVRFYDLNRAWVSVVVENDWATYRKNITYDVTVKIGKTTQTTVLSRTGVTQYHDSRWRRVFWWGGNPGAVQIGYSMPYFVSTGVIPRYDTNVKVTAAVTLGDTSLMGNGTIALYFPTTGGREDIGLYPGWAARYLCSSEDKYWKETYSNGQQGASCPVHIRDSSTLKIYSIDKHPTVTLNASPRQWSNKNDTIALESGVTPWSVDDAHQPSLAFIPYLFSGEYFFLEELYFWANFNFLSMSYEYRGRDSCLLKPLQVRGQAWCLRTLTDAAFIAPDGSWEKGYFADKLNKNLQWYADKMVPSNPLGMYGDQSNVGSDGGRPDENMRGDVRYYISPWQSDFLAIAFDHALDLEYAKARVSRDWLVNNIIGRFTNSPAFNPFDGATYHLASKDTAGHSYSTWGEVWQASFAGRTGGAPTILSADDCVHGYPYIARAALTGGVRDNLPKAAEAWAFLNPKLPGACWSTTPTWAFVPGGPSNVERIPLQDAKKEAGSLSISISRIALSNALRISIHGATERSALLSAGIFNVSGRLVADLTSSARKGATVWNAGALAPGMYVVKVMTNSTFLTKIVPVPGNY